MKVEWIDEGVEFHDSAANGFKRRYRTPVVRVSELSELVRIWRAQQQPKQSVAFRMAMRKLEDAVIMASLPKEGQDE